MHIHVTTKIAPRDPKPTSNPELTIVTHWDVDDEEWQEYGIDFDGEQYCSPTIGIGGCELAWYPRGHDADSLIEYVTEVFGNWPLRKHYSSDEEHADGVFDGLGDPYIGLEAVGCLYNVFHPEDLGDEAIEKLASPDNWHEVGERTFEAEG